jgi:outer membrane protein assembly factor BamD (BamD/ComL family)
MTPAKVAAWKEERALFQEVKNLYDAGRYQEAKTRANRFLSLFPKADKRDWVLRLKRKATQKLAKDQATRSTLQP